MPELRRYLETSPEALAVIRNEPWDHELLYKAFVYTFGREFVRTDPLSAQKQFAEFAIASIWEELEDALRFGRCYNNHFALAWEFPDRFQYVEGYYLDKHSNYMEANHAWALLDGQILVDITSYVPPKREKEWVKQQRKLSRGQRFKTQFEQSFGPKANPIIGRFPKHHEYYGVVLPDQWLRWFGPNRKSCQQLLMKPAVMWGKELSANLRSGYLKEELLANEEDWDSGRIFRRRRT